MNATHRTSRGVSLVEAMVALAVMAFGMLAVVGVQSTLRLNADIARQRSEATRLAQETLEKKRDFTVIDSVAGQSAWADIVAAGPTNEVIGNTTYRVRSFVTTYTDPPAKALRVEVKWEDRAGGEQTVELNSAIAGAAPGLSGTLAIRPGTAAVAPVRRPMGRHPTIPVAARDFGDKSAFVPPSLYQRTIIVFDNVSGLITGLCLFEYEDVTNESITPDSIQSCSDNTTAQLLSGYVRFQRRTDGGELTAADVENPLGPALRLRMQVQLSSSGHPEFPLCFDDANVFSVAGGALPLVTYYCVVFSNSSLTWSGISTVVAQDVDGDASHPWQIGSDNGTLSRYRVCRYTTASSDAQSIANVDHPRNYSNVGGNLTNQNFVVVSALKSCPTDTPANPTGGDFVNSNTLQHQPAPS